MPDVVGLAEDKAMAVLYAAGFVGSLTVTAGRAGQPDTRTAGGTVAAQSPAAGGRINADAPIEVIVGGFTTSASGNAIFAGEPSSAPGTG